MRGIFENRRAAGQALAAALSAYRATPGLLVLALPRGGVPVAYEVARALHAELDIVVVRKLGVPGHPELAMGAIASAGAQVLNQDVIQHYEIQQADIEAVQVRERDELIRREQLYRGERPRFNACGRTVIVVDDGLATGATMRAAVTALASLKPAKIVVAVPVAPRDTVESFSDLVDDFVCVETPWSFYSVGNWYRDFPQTEDAEVRSLLRRMQAQPDESIGYS